MIKNTKVNAAILIIGNEILSGRTQDTNTSTIALWLNSIGVKVGEVRVIPDVEKTIIDTLNLLRKNYDYVFTTGGIGPTHDDITAESVSKTFRLKYEIHKEAFKILEAYYKQGEFNEGRQKMVWMPKNANLILNPTRSEEHTSELQSQSVISYAVFCLKKRVTSNFYLFIEILDF